MKEWKLEGVSGLEEPSLQSGNAGDEKRPGTRPSTISSFPVRPSGNCVRSWQNRDFCRLLLILPSVL